MITLGCLKNPTQTLLGALESIFHYHLTKIIELVFGEFSPKQGMLDAFDASCGADGIMLL